MGVSDLTGNLGYHFTSVSASPFCIGGILLVTITSFQSELVPSRIVLSLHLL